MYMKPEVKDLLEDAERLVKRAIEEMEVDLRDAAEKAWVATLQATNALILERTGKVPERTPETSVELHRLCAEEPEVEGMKLVERYHTRSDYLHGQCFYMGICIPTEAVKRRIRETREYVEDVKKLVS